MTPHPLFDVCPFQCAGILTETPDSATNPKASKTSMQLGKGVEIVSKLLVVHRKCTSERSTRIFILSVIESVDRRRRQLGTPPALSLWRPTLPVCSLSSNIRRQLTRTWLANIHYGQSPPSTTATYVRSQCILATILYHLRNVLSTWRSDIQR
jgi:hypothetical protein